MKKLLFVTGEFFPYVTANVNCMREILRGLRDEGFQIDVLTVGYDAGTSAPQEIDGCRVFRAEVTEYTRIDRALHAQGSALNRLPGFVKAAIAAFLSLFVHRIKRRRMRNLFFTEMREPYDVMLSVANPIDGHLVAYGIARRTKIPWVLYNLDPYVYHTEKRTSTAWMRKLRVRLWTRAAAGGVTTTGTQEENARHGYDPYRDLPHMQIPLPNLTIADTPQRTAEKTAGGKIVLRYTGTFYADIRRPDELLRFLQKLDPQRFTAEFYGQCCAFLRASGVELPACARLFKPVSIAECRRLTETADVLVNVGNLCANQVPSKVFEYIATGKPILNFYSIENDTSLIYLNRYPAVLSAKSADGIGQDDLLRIYDGGRQIGAETLREIYADCLCENVVRRFASFLNTVSGNTSEKE